MVKITSLRGALIREFAAADKGSPGCVKRTAALGGGETDRGEIRESLPVPMIR